MITSRTKIPSKSRRINCPDIPDEPATANDLRRAIPLTLLCLQLGAQAVKGTQIQNAITTGFCHHNNFSRDLLLPTFCLQPDSYGCYKFNGFDEMGCLPLS